MEWISVEERLPEEWTEVLWISKTDGILIGRFHAEWDWGDEYLDRPAIIYAGMPLKFRNFTHWMPLPEPPVEAP